MDFTQARKEFELLKRAYVNGAISLDDLREKVDTDLEVTDENGQLWKIDEDSGVWLFYDPEQESWEEKKPEGISSEYYEEQDEVKISITPPVSPKIPEDVYEDWKKHVKNGESGNKTSAPGKTPDAPPPVPAHLKGETSVMCSGCNRENKAGTKFCVGCGIPIKQEAFCGKCGKQLKPDNKFCTGCGEKI